MVAKILENSNFIIFAQIPLLIFMGVFLLILFRTWRYPRKEMDKMAQLPIEKEKSNIGGK